MKALRRLDAAAWAAGLAFLAACSDAKSGDTVHVDAGPDAPSMDAGAPAEGSAEEASDASPAAGDAQPASCASPCDGSCVAGRCLMTLVALAPNDSPRDLVVRGSRAYVATCMEPSSGGTVTSVPLAGGPSTTLVSGTGCPVSLAVDDTSIYIAGSGFQGAAGGIVLSAPLDGGAPTTLASGADIPIGLAVDSASAYWTSSSGTLARVPLGGGSPVILASGLENATRPLLGGDAVVWADSVSGSIERISVDGGSPAVLARADSVTGLSITGTEVVFASGYTLMAAPLAGGPTATLGTAAGAPVIAVATDDANAYFTSYSTIWRVPLGGGVAVALASNQGTPGAIVVDATSVYWTNETTWPPQPDGGGGQVMKLSPK